MQRQATYNDHVEMNTIVGQAIKTIQTQNQKIETLEKTKEALEEKISLLEEQKLQQQHKAKKNE